VALLYDKNGNGCFIAVDGGWIMSILYVIGNGFDLWYGLPTSYSDFHQCHGSSLEEYSEYFSLGTGPLWHSFENDLGRFAWSSFYDNHNHTDPMADNFRHSEVYGFEDDLREQAEGMVEHFKELFTEWIESIDIDDTLAKFPFINNARYLSFNYTSLLDSLYGINQEKVLHIHGSLTNGGQLVFGHGLSIHEEPEMDEDGNSNRHMFSDSEGAAKYPLYKLKKPVDEILEREQNYFQSLHDVNVVVILGHSLNDIDLPYFRQIFVAAPNSYWIVSYREDEAESHAQQLEKCGIPTTQFTLSNIENIPVIIENLLSGNFNSLKSSS